MKKVHAKMYFFNLIGIEEQNKFCTKRKFAKDIKIFPKKQNFALKKPVPIAVNFCCLHYTLNSWIWIRIPKLHSDPGAVLTADPDPQH